MPRFKSLPARDRLLSLFDDIGETIRWRNPPGSTRSPGGEVRYRNAYGYYLVNIGGSLFQVHRLLWLMRTGEDPGDKDVDHIDNDRTNNSQSNLRLATRSQNLCNQRIRSDNTSGVKGVHWSKSEGRWQAYIHASGKRKHLGRFDTLEEAQAVVSAAREKLHGEFARHA